LVAFKPFPIDYLLKMKSFLAKYGKLSSGLTSLKKSQKPTLKVSESPKAPKHSENNPESVINSKAVEIDGPKGPEPTRYGDWERKGKVSDF
jgi:hypothetical protein